MKNRIFQILINQNNSLVLPEPIQQITNDIIQHFPEYEYSLWGDSQIRELLQADFDPEVYNAYCSLAPFAYRSDLARYCLLYRFGGWYIDLGIQLAKQNVVSSIANDIEMIFFWDLGDLKAPYRSFYDCMNGLIYSKPNNPVLRKAIELVVGNCKSNYYGSDSMSPTGPGVFGRSIAIVGKSDKYYDGHFMQLTPQHDQKNKAYVMRTGEIFAWHRSHINSNMKDLSDFGIEGGNDYRNLWRNRKVYIQ